MFSTIFRPIRKIALWVIRRLWKNVEFLRLLIFYRQWCPAVQKWVQMHVNINKNQVTHAYAHDACLLFFRPSFFLVKNGRISGNYRIFSVMYFWGSCIFFLVPAFVPGYLGPHSQEKMPCFWSCRLDMYR